MNTHEILLAEKNEQVRGWITALLEQSGHEVYPAESATAMLWKVLEKNSSIVVLGGGFDDELETGELVSLMKGCNRTLRIILVSDDPPLSVMRRIRENGIFYHALRPARREDAAEIAEAVASALGEKAEHGEMEALAAHVRSLTSRRAIISAAGVVAAAALAAAICGSMGIVRVDAPEGGTSMWIFLAFCALIVVSQLLPLLREARRLAARAALRGKSEGRASATGHGR